MEDRKKHGKKRPRRCADRRRYDAQLAQRKAKNPAFSAFFQLAAIFYGLVATMPLPQQRPRALSAPMPRSNGKRRSEPEYIPTPPSAQSQLHSERKTSPRELTYRRMSTARLIIEVAKGDVTAAKWALPILTNRVPDELSEWWQDICDKRAWSDIRYVGYKSDASEAEVAEKLMEAALPWYQEQYKQTGATEDDSAKAMIMRLKASRRRPPDDGDEPEPAPSGPKI